MKSLAVQNGRRLVSELVLELKVAWPAWRATPMCLPLSHFPPPNVAFFFFFNRSLKLNQHNSTVSNAHLC